MSLDITNIAPCSIQHAGFLIENNTARRPFYWRDNPLSEKETLTLAAKRAGMTTQHMTKWLKSRTEKTMRRWQRRNAQ